MSLEKLQARHQQLLIQRSQGKDIVEASESELKAVSLAINSLNEYIKSLEEEDKDKN